MALFDDVKRGLSATGRQVAKKTKELSETVQLKSQINTEKETINRLYASIGKQVFEAAGEEAEKKFFSEFGSIRKSMTKIKELEIQLTTMDGCIFCSECGARIDKDSTFCNHCGAKVNKNKLRVGEAVAESMMSQMEGTKEEEQETQSVVTEIENASADITIDMVNH